MPWKKERTGDGITNKYITFKGGEGKFVYRDKEKEKNIEVKTPFKILILEELHTVKGWHDKSESGIYSNEVRDLGEELTVKSFEGGEIASGLYGEIKDKIKAQGARYTKSVYALLNGEIVNLQLKGAALTAWIEAEFDINCVIVDVDPETRTKGKTEYYVPMFQEAEPTDKEVEQADEASDKLKDYLDNKMVSKVEKTEDDVIDDAIGEPTVKEGDSEDLPF